MLNWLRPRPEDVHVDGRRLDAAAAQLAAAHPDVRSIVVVRSSRLVWEHYVRGCDRDIIWDGQDGAVAYGPPYEVSKTPHQRRNIKSATKSVLSLLVGIAEHQGLLGRDDPIAKHLPDCPPDRGEITLLDLLRMRSGLEWVENGDITFQWVCSSDPLRFTLHEQRAIAPPGTRWEYSTADTHLLGACLAAAVDEDLLTYANDVLFAPLGIHADTWLADPTGLRVGGSELFLAPRELAAIGELVLRRGGWRGKQVVPTAWIDDSTQAQDGIEADLFRVHEPDGSYRAVELPSRRRLPGEGYAWLWWCSTLADRRVQIAHGLGGQMVVVDAESDAVVVATYAVDAADPEARLRSRFGLLNDLLMPAVMRGDKAHG